ncbi:MAG TPA: type IX secretion system membrane protein PorP/SprF, partial [Saprospiraceae bacterium]|nr:type IX secretion system membrane protein PorP/SprF [Saprospiraceae bacterium]
MIKKILFIPFFIATLMLTAQDQDFTQFYGAPVSLNPALTGAFNGTFRFSAIYRDQWRKVLDNPITTFAGSADFRFNVLKANRSHDAAGIGMVFYNDKPGLTFSTNRLMFSGAFHKGLGKSGEQYLSVGFQAGIAQQNVGLSKLTFDDQFNGSTGYTDGTDEDFPENNFAFGDYNFGLNYSYTPAKRLNIYTGFAMSHILEPRVSFYYDPKNPLDFPDNHLYRKYTAYVNLSIPIGDAMKLSPRV